MQPSQIISAYRAAPAADQSSLREYFIFKLRGEEGWTGEDENIEMRTELTEALLHDFSSADLPLIRQLYREELMCESAIRRHDNLYQLSFYLFWLGHKEDSFLLYEAKYIVGGMDAGTMQDREMMTVGYEPEEIISYVRDRFEKDPELEKKYPGFIKELQALVDHPDVENIAAYAKFIRGYFLEDDGEK